MLAAAYVDLLHRKAARIVTKRVPFGELNSVSELSPTARLTENAESVPLGVFLGRPVFRGILARPANSPDVSGSLFNSGVRKKLPQSHPRAGDLDQNSLSLWLTGISELTT